MQYLILIYSDESKAPETPTEPEAFAAYMKPWQDYDALLTEAGVMRGGDALLPAPTAKTVTRTTGDLLVTDGPFAETREQLGGYYLIECDSMDEAVKWGSHCPAVHFGRVEVREVMDLSAFS